MRLQVRVEVNEVADARFGALELVHGSSDGAVGVHSFDLSEMLWMGEQTRNLYLQVCA